MSAVAPVQRFVVVGEPGDPNAGRVSAPDRSWDAFWLERKGNRAETIRGVSIRVPTGMTLAYQQTVREDLDRRGSRSYPQLAADLFRAPDGTQIPDLWQRWVQAGMEVDELEVVIRWGLRHAAGDPITFEEAVDQLAEIVAAHTERDRAGEREPVNEDDLIRQHWAAIEASLQAHYGISPEQIPELTVREFNTKLAGLPADSAFVRAAQSQLMALRPTVTREQSQALIASA